MGNTWPKQEHRRMFQFKKGKNHLYYNILCFKRKSRRDGMERREREEFIFPPSLISSIPQMVGRIEGKIKS
jgi:hypothetical protein